MQRALSFIGCVLVVCSACTDGQEAPPTTTAGTTAPTTIAPTTTSAPATTTVPATSSTTTTAVTTTTITTTAPPTTTTTVAIEDVTLALETVVTGLGQPLFLDAPPGDARLFIVDQPGLIWIVKDGDLLEEPFLDIRDIVLFGGERGLLGLAFHPGFAGNRRFYINYIDGAGNTIVTEYVASSDPDRADPTSARLLLEVQQPAPNHNGGMLAFGPDGYLYISLGDGGGGGDQFGNGQRPDTLLGTILRIDVDGGDPYGIPPTNPFVAGGGAPEVWLWGLRNPWRFAFDLDRDLYIADVGQSSWEEIDVVPVGSGGGNLGWPIMEGNNCFRPSSGCDESGLIAPVLEYSHEQGCSVTGGYPFRGTDIPEIQGHYFYGDFCSGQIRSFRLVGVNVVQQRDWTDDLGLVPDLTSFGTDSEGRLYVMSATGTVHRFVRGGSG